MPRPPNTARRLTALALAAILAATMAATAACGKKGDLTHPPAAATTPPPGR